MRIALLSLCSLFLFASLPGNAQVAYMSRGDSSPHVPYHKSSTKGKIALHQEGETEPYIADGMVPVGKDLNALEKMDTTTAIQFANFIANSIESPQQVAWQESPKWPDVPKNGYRLDSLNGYFIKRGKYKGKALIEAGWDKEVGAGGDGDYSSYHNRKLYVVSLVEYERNEYRNPTNVIKTISGARLQGDDVMQPVISFVTDDAIMLMLNYYGGQRQGQF